MIGLHATRLLVDILMLTGRPEADPLESQRLICKEADRLPSLPSLHKEALGVFVRDVERLNSPSIREAV